MFQFLLASVLFSCCKIL